MVDVTLFIAGGGLIVVLLAVSAFFSSSEICDFLGCPRMGQRARSRW
ncbi:MAG: hypothetical protein V5A45_04675 [Haloarculaceae archaeon]